MQGKGAARLDLKRTFVEARDRPKFRAGYFRWLRFLVFTALYLTILVIQMDVNGAIQIDEALRRAVVDELGALQKVVSPGDFFVYLENQIMPNVFPSAWYSSTPLSSARNETGFVLGYNKLVGGLLLTQKRAMIKPHCKVPLFKSFSSSYQDFEPVCLEESQDISSFVNDSMREKFPIGTKREVPALNWSSDPGWTTMVPWTLHVVEDPMTKKRMVEALEMAPPLSVNDTRLDPNNKDFYTAFTYTMPKNTKPPHPFWGFWSEGAYGKKEPQDSDGAFRLFFAPADGAATNVRKMHLLKKHLWLDIFTREVDIKFAVYNGMLRMFTYVQVRFRYSLTGTLIPWNTAGGSSVKIQSIDMEQYLSGRRGVQVALEVIFMVWLFYEIITYIREGAQCLIIGWDDALANETDLSGRRSWPQKPKIGSPRLGFKSWLLNIWTWIDAINYFSFVIFVVIRISLMTMMMNEDNIVKVPSNYYVISLEYASSIISSQHLFNFLNIMLSLLRLFKHIHFHPRLGIVPQTLAVAAQDLLHFLLIFMTFVMGFAVIGHVLFGVETASFSTFPSALNTVYIMMLTGSANVAKLSHNDGDTSTIFYLLILFLITIILLAVMLAILVDSYMTAKEEECGKWKQEGYEVLPTLLGQLFSWRIFRRLWQDPRAVDEDILLQSLWKIKDDLEEKHQISLYAMSREQRTITIQDILNQIPVEVRVATRVTVENIARASVLHFRHENEAEEDVKYEHVGDALGSEIPRRPDQNAEMHLWTLRLKDLIQENLMLQAQHRRCVAQGLIKSHQD